MTDSQGMLHFTRNAYRILGVLGNASQDAIAHAADVMDASLKMGVTNTTAWDLPWLGNLPRSESDVKDAVMRLSDPAQRLRERLFWFHEGETLLKGLTRDNLGEIAAKWGEMDRPAARHDATLLNLLAALILDPRFEDSKRWREVLEQWRQLAEAEEYWKLLADLESSNLFNPHSTSEQLDALRAEALKLVIDSMAGNLRDSAVARDRETARRLLGIFRMAELPAELVDSVQNAVLGPMEDEFYALCSEVRRKCDDNVIKDGKYAEDNQRICRDALARFDAEVEPALALVMELAGKDSAVSRRARERAAFCLHGLALNHIWAEEYDISKSLVARAKDLAPPDSLILSRIEETVSSVAESAREKKAPAREEPVIKLEPEGSGAAMRWLQGMIVVLVVVIAIGIYVRLAGNHSDEQESPVTPTDKPSSASKAASRSQEELVARVTKDSAPKAPSVHAPPSSRETSLKTPTKDQPVSAKMPQEKVAKSSQPSAIVARSGSKESPARPVAADKKKLKSLEARISKSTAALSRLEARLESELKELEAMDKSIVAYRSSIESFEQQIKSGAQADIDGYKKTVADYNGMVRKYNKRLAESRRTAAEHDDMQKKHRQLTEQYQGLSSQ